MAAWAWAELRPLRPAIIRAAWAAAGLGRDITLEALVAGLEAGRDCWAITLGGRSGSWACISLVTLDRGQAETVAAEDFFSMERPPKLGPWDTEARSLWPGPVTTRGELLEVLLEDLGFV